MLAHALLKLANLGQIRAHADQVVPVLGQNRPEFVETCQMLDKFVDQTWSLCAKRHAMFDQFWAEF